MKKALVIIDVQNDFLKNGSLEVPKGDEIIPLINETQKEFDLILATQDWHPANHKSFACNHLNHEPFDKILYRGYEQTLWPAHCIAFSKRAEISDKLNQEKIQKIIQKGTNPLIDSYSAFFDNEKSSQTELETYLKEKNVNQVFFCGLAAEYCVYYSALDAKMLQFDTYYFTKLTRPISKENYERALAQMKKKKIHLI